MQNKVITEDVKRTPTPLCLLSKAATFSATCIILYIVISFVSNKLLFYYQTRNNVNAIYIWGSSTSYQGIDVGLLQEKTAKKIYSYSQHGAGPYDLLVFSQLVPDNSTIIVGFTELTFLRKINRDRSISGFMASALLHLYLEGYELEQITSIIKKNKIFKNSFSCRPTPYPFENYIKDGEWKLIVDLYTKDDLIAQYNVKSKVFYDGLCKLRDKGCNVKIVIFPISDKLKWLSDNSAYKSMTNNELLKYSKLGFEVYSSIKLNTSMNIMYDHTHVNALGRTLMTNYMCDHIL